MNTDARRINKNIYNMGISTIMPGQVWKIKPTHRDTQEIIGTNASLIKARPHIILSVSNSNAEVVPITSRNPLNDNYYVELPRFDKLNEPTNTELNYVAIPKTRTVAVESFEYEGAKLIAAISPALLEHCISVLLAYKYLGYFNAMLLTKIVNDAIDFDDKLESYTYISSKYKKYANDILFEDASNLENSTENADIYYINND